MELMRNPQWPLARLCLLSAVITACTDSAPTGLVDVQLVDRPDANVAVSCTGSRVTKTVSCGEELPAGLGAGIIGGQNTYVKITTSNVSYDSGTQTFRFDATIQNLLNESIGTPAGGVVAPMGTMVFFTSGPTVTGGSGVITVGNADGTATFTGPSQPYFTYTGILGKDEVSPAKTWELSMPTSVTGFAFNLLIQTEVAPKLVINEMYVNPGGLISDANGEWVEIYNAGSLPVQMEGLVIADSAASGRRPYHLISGSLIVPAGGYVTLGNTTNTVNNGGAPVDYAYGSAIAFANSLDAFKISRVYGTDTLTIDRVQFASAAVSAQNGISRELKNPALDNVNMDGSNWADASVTAVFGPSGRGTPKAQNSSFTPFIFNEPTVPGNPGRPRTERQSGG
jgi:hypothetical protein